MAVVAGFLLETGEQTIAPGATEDFGFVSAAEEFTLTQAIVPSAIGDNVEVVAILNADAANVLAEPMRGSWFAEYRPAPSPWDEEQQGPRFVGELKSDAFTVRIRNVTGAPVAVEPVLVGVAVT